MGNNPSEMHERSGGLKMLVKMTDEDIRDGKRLHASGCPVALAVKRSMEDEESCIVMARQSHIYIKNLNQDGHGSYYKPSVPQRDMVANFIRDFDKNLDVKKLPAFTIRSLYNVN